MAYFGCSYTYGEGVNDEQTLPSAGARHAPNLQHYNYGLSGYGPQETLAWMESGQLPAQLKEKSGTAIHVFMDGHVERAIGSQYIYNQWGPNMPYYDFNAKKVLVRMGSFSTGRPWISLAYLLLGRSDLARLLKVNFPTVADRHFNITAAILAQSRDKFEAQFPGSHFAVLIYPGSKLGDRLKKHLAEKKVTVLDYAYLLPNYTDKWTIRGDGHPTGQAHEAVAKKLATFTREKMLSQKPFQTPGQIDPP